MVFSLFVLTENESCEVGVVEVQTDLKPDCLLSKKEYFNGWIYPPHPTILPSQTKPNDHRCHGSCACQQVQLTGLYVLQVYLLASSSQLK